MNHLSCCGTDCGGCECYGNLCKGCNESEGKVFFVQEGQACPIYECVINRKRFKNCGNCREVPCSVWKNTRDPKYTDKEFAENIEARLRALRENV